MTPEEQRREFGIDGLCIIAESALLSGFTGDYLHGWCAAIALCQSAGCDVPAEIVRLRADLERYAEHVRGMTADRETGE